MMQKAAYLYDAGDDMAGGRGGEHGEVRGAEAGAKAVDQAVHTLGATV